MPYKESDMFIPLKNYLENKGYEVYSEVNDIDIVGINRNNGKVMLLEMKLNFNIKVIIQTLKNKKYNRDAKCYIAVAKNGHDRGFTKSDYEKIDLLNLTGFDIGILTVDLNNNTVKCLRNDNTKENSYTNFNRLCCDLHKEKTAGAKTGETLTERTIIINRIIGILNELPNNKCDIHVLTKIFVPSILNHYSNITSFKSVIRNTASHIFKIEKNFIILLERND